MKRLVTTLFFLYIIFLPLVSNSQTSCATAAEITYGGCKSGSFITSPTFWFKFVATSTAVTITSSGNGYGVPALSIYNACNASTYLAQADPGGKLNCGRLIVGNTYFIRVDIGWDWTYYKNSNYNVCLNNLAVPVNDECTSGIDLGCVLESNGEVDKATPSLSDSKNDIWYSFTPTASSGSIILDIGSKFDGVIELWDACGGTLIKKVDDKIFNPSYVDNTGTIMDETLNYSSLTVGKTYSVRIYNNNWHWYGGVHYNKNNTTVEPFKVKVSGSTSPAPIVISPVVFPLNSLATPLSAIGSNLEWYDSGFNSIGTTAPVPNTSVAGTYTYYVTQSPNSCLSVKAKIDVIVKGAMASFLHGFAETFAGSSEGYTDGKAASAKFKNPAGLVVDDNGFVYVADCNNNRIRKISPEGVVSTFAGSGSVGVANNTNGLLAQFNAPTGLAIDAVGNIFVTDKGNNRIRKITAGGSVSLLAGTNPGSADGTGASAQFTEPLGIAADKQGTLYVTMGTKIRKILPSGVVSTLGGTNNMGLKDGPLSVATFADLNGIAIDTAGNIFVSEYYYNLVRKVSKQGYVSTFTGNNVTVDQAWFDQWAQMSQSVGFTNGRGNSARFSNPAGITINKSNNLIVADYTNKAFREITADSLVSTYHAALTGLYSPRFLTSDKYNVVYFTTGNSSKVYRIIPLVTSFNTDFGKASETQLVKIAGKYLTENVSIKSPEGFEISFDPASVFLRELSYTPVGEEIDSVSLYVRLSAGALPGSYNDNLTVNMNGEILNYLTLTGIVRSAKMSQEITFNSLLEKVMGDVDFTLDAVASSGLDITYSSSDPGVAVITGNTVKIMGTGMTTITASQSGNEDYYPAQDVTQVLKVCAEKPKVTSPVSYCQNDIAAVLTASGTNNTWYLSEEEITGTTQAPLPNTSVAGTTTYFVTQEDGGCESGRAEIKVIVNPLPSLAITGSFAICNEQSTTLMASGASAYLWSTTEEAHMITVSPAETTTYSVTGTDENGCRKSEEVTVVVSTCTGIHDVISTSFNLNPNPTSGEFVITTSAIADNIAVMNVLGKIIAEIEPSALQTTVSLNGFDSGVYFVKILSGGKLSVNKIVKQ